MIHVTCRCSKTYDVSDELEGKTAKCGCGNEFTICKEAIKVPKDHVEQKKQGDNPVVQFLFLFLFLVGVGGVVGALAIVPFCKYIYPSLSVLRMSKYFFGTGIVCFLVLGIIASIRKALPDYAAACRNVFRACRSFVLSSFTRTKKMSHFFHRHLFIIIAGTLLFLAGLAAGSIFSQPAPKDEFVLKSLEDVRYHNGSAGSSVYKYNARTGETWKLDGYTWSKVLTASSEHPSR